MKTAFKSRRHRNPPVQDVQTEQQQQPFFSKTNTSALGIQTKRDAFFQPKLTIGQPDDQYEREADAVADNVVNNQTTPSVQKQKINSIQRLSTPDEEKMPATNDGRMAEDKKIQEKPAVQKMEAPKEEEKPAVQKMEAPKEEEKPAVQKMEAPKEEEKPAVQKMEAPKEEEKPAVQKMEAPKEEEKPAVQKMEAPKEEEEQPVQAKANNAATNNVASPSLSSKIDNTKGNGNHLPVGTKKKMETAFGRDFSDVNIHTDTSSVEMNQEINAQAFTHGKDIYFNSGKFNPENTEGSRLLAHELTHVVQQKGDTIQRGGSKEEEEAKAVAVAKAKLKATYKLKSVDDGDKPWTSAELALVEKALASLPAPDKAAIVNVELIRTQNIHGVDSRTAGLFSSHQAVENTTVTNDASIKLGDIAFKDGEPNQSILTIVHEVGHAVASLKTRAANNAEHLAMADFNTKVGISNAANDLLGEDKPAFKTYKDKFDEAEAKNNERNQKINNEQKPLIAQFNNAKTAKEQAALQPQLDALKAEIANLKTESDKLRTASDTLYADYQKLEKDSATKKAATDTAKITNEAKEKATKATMIAPADLAQISATADAGKHAVETNAKAALTGTEVEKKEAEAYTRAVNQAATAILKFHDHTKAQDSDEKTVDGLIKIVDTDIETRNTEKANLTKTNAKNSILGALAATEKMQDDYYNAAKAHALAHERKAIIQAFVKFVEANHISPNLTKYAADSWPHKPEEFYAEAYSFFVADNAALEKHSSKLNAWFKANTYRP